MVENFDPKAGGVVPGKAKPRGLFPHVRRAGDFLFVSGTSSRLPDNTIVGALSGDPVTRPAEIHAQTLAVLKNIEEILRSCEAEISDVTEISTFLVDMQDFDSYTAVWADFFVNGAPARTTVAVHQLPHPHLLIEMKAIAYLPVKL
jgi:2-aminomuconate deaminase